MVFYQPEVRRIARQHLENFASSLEAERIRLGLARDAFLKLISISSPRYSGWLSGRGNPSLQTIIAVFSRLGWEEEHLGWLFRQAGNPNLTPGPTATGSRQENHYNDSSAR